MNVWSEVNMNIVNKLFLRQDWLVSLVSSSKKYDSICSYNVVINETDISHDNVQSNMVQKFIFSVLNCC